jgi:chromosome segregation ATPase
MAVRKKTSARKKTSTRRPPAAANPSRQIAALRAEVKALQAKLVKESRLGQINARLLSEARKARMELTRQITALRSQGNKLATQLKSSLGDAKRREQARKEALARVADLRKELATRTEEVRRKSEELRRLAQESARRAVEIIRSEPPTDAQAAAIESAPERKPDYSGGGSQSGDPQP